MGVEEGSVYTLDVNFTKLDFPGGQEPNEPNRDEEETEKMVRKMRRMIARELVQVRKNQVVLTSNIIKPSLFIMLLTFCFMIRRKYHL